MRLHKEHGLNATISKCIICGKDKNEIALLGAGYKGKAPMHMVTSVEPCEACRKKFLDKGVLLLEGEQTPKGPVPTGKLVVLKNKAFKGMFNTDVPKRKIAFVDKEVFEKFKFTE